MSVRLGLVDMRGEAYQKHLGTCVKLDIVSLTQIRPGVFWGGGGAVLQVESV